MKTSEIQRSLLTFSMGVKMDYWLEITSTYSPEYYSLVVLQFEHNFVREEAISESL